MSSGELKKALEELGEEDVDNKEGSLHVPDAEKLVAIPEASSGQTSARRSKRRVGMIDEVVTTSAERCKALRNEGTPDQPIPFSLVDDSVGISNLDNIGISLGEDNSSINDSWDNLKNSALGGMHERVSIDIKDKVIEKVEKEILEEEELDKIFLKKNCSEIMEEVMDLGSDCDIILPRGHAKKKKNSKGKFLKHFKLS
jgi:hypothetical protein